MKYFQAALLILVLFYMLRTISGYDDDQAPMMDTMIPGVSFYDDTTPMPPGF